MSGLVFFFLEGVESSGISKGFALKRVRRLRRNGSKYGILLEEFFVT